MTTPAPIVVSMGDPAGVGPEIILKAWHQLRHHPMAFAVIGEFDLFARSAEALGLAAPIPVDTPAQALDHFAECLPVLGTEAALSEPVVPGQPNPAHAAATKAAGCPFALLSADRSSARSVNAGCVAAEVFARSHATDWTLVAAGAALRGSDVEPALTVHSTRAPSIAGAFSDTVFCEQQPCIARVRMNSAQADAQMSLVVALRGKRVSPPQIHPRGALPRPRKARRAGKRVGL